MSSRKNYVLKSKKAKAPTRLVVLKPTKGLNNFFSPDQIDDREFSDSLNIQYDSEGGAQTRYGTVAIGDALYAPNGLAVLKTSAGVNQVVTCDFNTIKYLNGTTWTTPGGSTFASTGGPFNFTQAQDKLFAWNGRDGGLVYDGTTVTSPGTLPAASFSIYYQNKHIASGVIASQPNRLYISNVTDASDFTVALGGTAPQPDNSTDVPGATVFAGTPGLSEANIIDVRKNDGDKITGLGIFQDQVIVFKERAIYSLTFDSTGAPTITPITYSAGCVSHATIRAVENDLMFMSRDGIRSLGNVAQYFDAIRTTILSTPIQLTIDNIASENAFIASGYGFRSMNAIYYKNRYILAVPKTIDVDGIHKECIVYDHRFQAFSIWDTIEPAGMVTYTDQYNVDHLYYITNPGPSSPTVPLGQLYEYTATATDDNGATISSFFDSKIQTFGSPDVTKFFIDLGLVFHTISGTIQITVYDQDNTSLGSVTVASDSGGNTTRGFGVDEFGTIYLGTSGGADTEGSTITFADTPIRIPLNRQLRGIKFRVETLYAGDAFAFTGTIYAVFPDSHYLFDSSRKVYLS